MTAKRSPTPESALELAETLATLGTVDSEYRDFYLRRARELMAPVMSREALEAAHRERNRLDGLRDGVKRALEIGDWNRVGELAVTLRTVERQRAGTERVLAVAERVYGADVGITREALPAYMVSPLSTAELRAIQARTAANLEELTARDAEWSAFYTSRRAAVEALPVANRPEPVGAAAEVLREEAQQAFLAGRWEVLASLAQGFGATRGNDTDRCTCGPLPDDAPDPHARPLSSHAAAEYGLVEMGLEARVDLRTFLRCRCALTPSLSDEPLGEEGVGERSAPCGCHHRCPEIAERLHETLDLLKHRGFLTSLGTRYLPTFATENVLLETFPETQVVRGPLLEQLGLPRRLGLARLEIEEALTRGGADMIESLGLDPLEHVLVPVPFDIYLRAAERLRWGQRPHWTHLDGYQALRGWRLRALVGGNARYGGPADLCTIGRDDRRDDVLVRFCVVRRRHLQDHVGRATGARGANSEGGHPPR